jgi:outer membrane lipoprotein-sorting protein
MRQTSLIACVLAVSLFVSAIAPAAFAQQVSSDWANVQSVAPGDEVSVKLKDGHKVRGRFSSASDSELTILRKNKQQPIAMNTIAQVYRLERKAEKAKYAAIGAGIGAAAGGTIGGVKLLQVQAAMMVSTL